MFLGNKENFIFLSKQGVIIFWDTLFGIKALSKDELAKSTLQVESICRILGGGGVGDNNTTLRQRGRVYENYRSTGNGFA